MNEETHDYNFPKKREIHRTEIKSLSEIRRTMPNIIIGNEFVGISPMSGPTFEITEIIENPKDQSK